MLKIKYNNYYNVIIKYIINNLFKMNFINKFGFDFQFVQL